MIRLGTKWMLVGSVGGQLLQFAIGIILARLLLPAEFGLVVTIQVFTGFVGLIASGGMGQALVQAKKASEKDFQVMFTMQLLIGCLAYFLFYVIAPWFAVWFNNPAYALLLRVSAISFLLRPFLNIHTSWLHRETRFRSLSINSLVLAILVGSTSILMALNGFGVWSLVVSGLIGSLINIVILSFLTPLRPSLLLDREILRRIGTYGIKVTFNDLINYFVIQTNNLIISLKAGPGMVGMFNKADSLGSMPINIISSAVYKPVFRAMSQAQDDLDMTRYLFHKMISLLIVYTLPFYIGLAWVADPFIPFVFGENWRGSIDPLEVFGFIGITFCIIHPCGSVLAAQNRLGREVIVHFTQWIIVSIACYVGLSWGLRGVAWGYFISYVYATTFMYILVRQAIHNRLHELVTAIFPGLLLNAIMLIALFIISALLPTNFKITNPAYYLAITVIGGATTYAMAFLFIPIKSISQESARWRKLIRIPDKKEA